MSCNSRHVENPTNINVTNLKRTLRYLQGSRDLGIKYGNQGDIQTIKAYCDSDYASDVETRRSTSGYAIYYCGGPISWASRRQPLVALSSTEAEFIAAADCCKELLYLKSLLREITGEIVHAEMNIDNQSAIKLVKSGIFNRRSKHIDVRYHFLSEKVNENNISINYINTNNQIADILTKPLEPIKFKKFKNMLLC